MFLAKSEWEGHCLNPCWFEGDHVCTFCPVTALHSGCYGSGPTSSSLCGLHLWHLAPSNTSPNSLVASLTWQTQSSSVSQDVHWMGVSLDYLSLFRGSQKACGSVRVPLSSSVLTVFLTIFTMCCALQWSPFHPNSFPSLLSVLMQSHFLEKICCPASQEGFLFVGNALLSGLLSYWYEC